MTHPRLGTTDSNVNACHRLWSSKVSAVLGRNDTNFLLLISHHWLTATYYTWVSKTRLCVHLDLSEHKVYSWKLWPGWLKAYTWASTIRPNVPKKLDEEHHSSTYGESFLGRFQVVNKGCDLHPTLRRHPVCTHGAATCLVYLILSDCR